MMHVNAAGGTMTLPMTQARHLDGCLAFRIQDECHNKTAGRQLVLQQIWNTSPLGNIPI